MFATDAQQAAGIDENAVMPTVPDDAEPGTPLSDLKFPHLHQNLDKLNQGYHHPTPTGAIW